MYDVQMRLISAAEVTRVYRFSFAKSLVRAASAIALIAVAVAAFAAPSEPPARIQVTWAPIDQLDGKPAKESNQ